MDTNVVVSAYRSSKGASYELLRRLYANEWTAVLSNHLVHEYEEKLMEFRHELELSESDIAKALAAICARAVEIQLRPGWLPILTDADDEPLVELAIESEAWCIVTHNVRHLLPAKNIGIAILKPGEFVGILRAQV